MSATCSAECGGTKSKCAAPRGVRALAISWPATDKALARKMPAEDAFNARSEAFTSDTSPGARPKRQRLSGARAPLRTARHGMRSEPCRWREADLQEALDFLPRLVQGEHAVVAIRVECVEALVHAAHATLQEETKPAFIAQQPPELARGPRVASPSVVEHDGKAYYGTTQTKQKT